MCADAAAWVQLVRLLRLAGVLRCFTRLHAQHPTSLSSSALAAPGLHTCRCTAALIDLLPLHSAGLALPVQVEALLGPKTEADLVKPDKKKKPKVAFVCCAVLRCAALCCAVLCCAVPLRMRGHSPLTLCFC